MVADKNIIVWVARIEVTPIDIDVSNMCGAFVNVVVLAVSIAEALSSICHALEKMGFTSLYVQVIQDHRRVKRKYRHKEELKRLVQYAKRTKHPQFGAFHSW